MEELFDLLEDGEKREEDNLKLREQVAVPVPGKGEQGVEPVDRAKDLLSEEALREEKDPEGLPEKRAAENGFDREAPGDIAERLLADAEGYVTEDHGQKLSLEWKDVIWLSRDAWDGDSEELRDRMKLAGEGLVGGGAAERWYERMERSQTGAEQLYLGINTPRLRGSEHGAHSVVVKLTESEVRRNGADGLDARALDRVFQRDARRYDGGLNLL